MAEPRKARWARSVASAALCLSFATMPALADRVPLPKPRPIKQQVVAAAAVHRPLTTGSIAAKPSIPAEALVARAQATPGPVTNPFAALLGQSGASSKGALTPEQKAIVDKVNAYLSSVQTLTGNFVQVGPDGGRTKGDFYMSKPGRIRFEYDDPSPIELIADGQSVVVRDRNLATQDVYPLSQTPLRFLLSDRVDLMKDTNLVAVYADDVFITVVVEERNGLVGTSRLMIMFSAKDMQLKQWTVTDPQGYDTTVAVFNLDPSKKPDPSMFRIDYTRYRN
ncbi:outer-membrane lipoprotein carrier protein LolA [Microbacteriaceae bacterium K1510]|nr:outer-membrane lipoprotein carrier protein LolA [Microbacteriaceae bacterium K1510]